MAATFDSLALGQITALDPNEPVRAGKDIFLSRSSGAIHKRGPAMPRDISLTTLFTFDNTLTPTQLSTRIRNWLDLSTVATLVTETNNYPGGGSRAYTFTNCMLRGFTEDLYQVSYVAGLSAYRGPGIYTFQFRQLRPTTTGGTVISG